MKDNIKKILRENTENVLYSAVVLDEKSRSLILSNFSSLILPDWKVLCHHMTIAFGKPAPIESDLGKSIELTIIKVGISDMVIACQVEGYPSANKIPHITLAVNPDGGKPVMSNQIDNWVEIPEKSQLKVSGIVTNITN